jgi:hypothetical protein
MPATRSRLRHWQQEPPSSSASDASPDLGAVAKEAVITFLHDASMMTAEREATRRSVGSTTQDTDGALAVEESAESSAWRAAAVSMDALDQIEAAAARVEADIAAASRAHAELQAGAAAAAADAVHAAQSALASAGTAVQAEGRAKVALRRIEHYVTITVGILIIAIIILTLSAASAH